MMKPAHQIFDARGHSCQKPRRVNACQLMSPDLACSQCVPACQCAELYKFFEGSQREPCPPQEPGAGALVHLRKVGPWPHRLHGRWLKGPTFLPTQGRAPGSQGIPPVEARSPPPDDTRLEKMSTAVVPWRAPHPGLTTSSPSAHWRTTLASR